METPFYHDDTFDHPDFLQPPHYGRSLSLKAVNKRTMAQNYPGTVGHAPGMKLLQGQPGSTCGANPNNLGLNGNTNAPLMAPSDMNHLKMAAPDLEHLIIHSGQGLVTTSPATGTTGSPFLYRNQVTNEQEGFADGFVKALADLHKQNQLVGSPVSPPSSIQGAYQRNVAPGGGEIPIYTNLCSYNPSQIPGSASYPEGQMPFTAGAGQSRGLDEPQTVPEVPHPPQEPTGSPPSLSPIDLESQEQIKAERKRLRNRIAASKCRKRKLERISRLEEKVKVLKTQNSDLASTAGILRQQVAQLKHKVMSHVTNGCQITLGSIAPPKSGQSSSC